MPKYLPLILLCILWSCKNTPEEIVLGKLTQEDKQLVVMGFISPQDSILTVKVSHSAPLGSSFEGSIVTNATVTLSTSRASIQLNYNGANMYYQALARQFPIQSGQSYSLSVSTPDGKQVTSTCTIPTPVQLQQVLVDSSVSLGQKQYSVRYRWQGQANQASYYQVAGAFQYVRTATQTLSSIPIVFGTPTHPGDLLSDESTKGILLESQPGLLTSVAETGQTWANTYQQATILANLSHIDAFYFRYHKALALAVASNGNPFAEPVSVPSNIKGGLGCFAGYNQATVKVRLK